MTETRLTERISETASEDGQLERTVENGLKLRLTPTQVKVMGLFAYGIVSTSKEAADHLVVSKRTIDFHLANLYDQMQVNNRISAIRAFERSEYFDPTQVIY